MPRYFFHIWNDGHYVIDPEGVELTDFEAAHNEATQSVREVVADYILTERVLGSRQLEVVDEFGDVLEAIPFKSVIRFDD